MVARGDLGIEVPAEDVPIIQKRIIAEARITGKPVIIATQMLDSMVHSSRPTRAEASDVANAIFDSTDAVMLSNESAAGDYPLQAVETMCRIIKKAENVTGLASHYTHSGSQNLEEAMTSAATFLLEDVDASAIVVPSFYGKTARLFSQLRPSGFVISPSMNARVTRQLALSWGIFPVLVDDSANPETLEQAGIQGAVSEGLLKEGDLIVVMTAPTDDSEARGIALKSVTMNSDSEE